MTGFIYLIRNSINGKGYIGKTVRPIGARFAAHKNAAKKGVNFSLYRAMRKYGVENFSISILQVCERSLLNDLEKQYIRAFGTKISRHGYNETDGGEGMCGYRQSSEHIAKRVAKQIGKKPSASHRRKLSEWQIGRVLSSEHKTKISRSRKGQLLSEEHKAKLRLARKRVAA